MVGRASLITANRYAESSTKAKVSRAPNVSKTFETARPQRRSTENGRPQVQKSDAMREAMCHRRLAIAPKKSQSRHRTRPSRCSLRAMGVRPTLQRLARNHACRNPSVLRKPHGLFCAALRQSRTGKSVRRQCCHSRRRVTPLLPAPSTPVRLTGMRMLEPHEVA